jgi:hypothetical protein
MATGAGLKLHGKNGAIYLHNKKGGAGAIKVTTKTEWTLNLSRDYVDATVFGDTNKTYLVGLKDIQGTYAGLLDLSGDYLINTTNSDTVQLYLYGDDTTVNSTGAEIMIANGPALMDASITSSISDAIKMTGNFRASGSWTVFSSGTL